MPEDTGEGMTVHRHDPAHLERPLLPYVQSVCLDIPAAIIV